MQLALHKLTHDWTGRIALTENFVQLAEPRCGQSSWSLSTFSEPPPGGETKVGVLLASCVPTGGVPAGVGETSSLRGGDSPEACEPGWVTLAWYSTVNSVAGVAEEPSEACQSQLAASLNTTSRDG